MVITGRGAHSKNGKGVMKDEIKVCLLRFIFERDLYSGK
jgi:DNA-nicking Smr family endonuclease